jgi:peptide/nickel transport system substrate-binding protein
MKSLDARRVLARCALAAASLLASAAPLAHAEETPQYGGVLTAILSPEPPTLNVAVQQVAGTQLVAGKIFESLLTYSFDLKPQPGLARCLPIPRSWPIPRARGR